jgi:hypothetical protein
MGWNRMQSESERKNQNARKPQEQIRGFLPFEPGMELQGTLEAIKVKDTGKGFFIIRATAACTVNVKAEDASPTGRGTAKVGDLVGVRKTGATKILSELKLGTLVSIYYSGLTERTSFNPHTKQMETAPYHDLTIDVYTPDTEEVKS